MTNQPYTHTGSGHTTKAGRLYYLDWFRVLAILVVFLHHCSKIFDYRETILYNSETSFAPALHREFNALWMMPLFFIISGAAVYFSLKSRNARAFVKERILRIALPLVFIGTFVINPPQVYVHPGVLLVGRQDARRDADADRDDQRHDRQLDRNRQLLPDQGGHRLLGPERDASGGRGGGRPRESTKASGRPVVICGPRG